MSLRTVSSAAAFIVTTAFVAFLALAPLSARETAPAPALWKIDGPAGDIYFFGSIHILPEGFKWRRPALEAALQQADRLVFELDLDAAKNPASMGAIVMKYGFLPPDRSLRRMLAPEHRMKLDAAALSLGVTPAAINRMRPWLAAVTLTSLSLIKQNTKPGKPMNPAAVTDELAGVDSQLWSWAKTAGKERGALETAEDQIRVFADLTEIQQIELLVVTLEEISKAPDMLDVMLDAWKKGDTAKLDRAFNADMNRFPALRNAVLHDRHEKWVPQIEAMMKDGKTHFIVVGTAHLVGQDSVIAMLRAKGVKVEGP
ncbi:MAG: TraB/GumN family protein [Alphaproteobacteria bacterium]|nr:TraB/GumN family protein [Alphaproteobacteria bacterium]